MHLISYFFLHSMGTIIRESSQWLKKSFQMARCMQYSLVLVHELKIFINTQEKPLSYVKMSKQ